MHLGVSIIVDITVSNIILKDIHYFSFDDKGDDLPLSSPLITTWIAVATLDYEANNSINLAKPLSAIPVSNKLQKYAVRKLFYQWIFKRFEKAGFQYIDNHREIYSNSDRASKPYHLLSQQYLILSNANFPYRLLPFNYYVCFSHSGNQVTCAINKYCPIGIDTEINTISMQVAERFYTSKEIEWLRQLNPNQRPEAISVLWMLKEALIKKTTTKKASLLSGLKTNVLLPAQNLLLSHRNENSRSSTNVHNVYSYQDISNSLKNTIYVYLPKYNVIAMW